MMSQPGYQVILKHILPNILRSKSNKSMKFGQLIEHNIRKISLKKSYTKCGAETISGPFIKNKN